jgi:microcystin-dependent protein
MDPYLGQIQAFAFNYAPLGWMKCEGQLLPIAQYSALFALLGTMYGGDGVTNFALPDLRGRVPISAGSGPGLSNHQQGEKGGTENVAITTNQMPAHSHAAGLSAIHGKMKCTDLEPNTDNPVGNCIARIPRYAQFSTEAPSKEMHADSIEMSGNVNVEMSGANQAHANMQPYLSLNYCIAVQGIFPPRN